MSHDEGAIGMEAIRIVETELLKTANPQLYRANGFRILGLSVNTTPRKVRRRMAEIKAAHEMDDLAAENQHTFALDPSPSHTCIRDAGNRLLDPMTRLLDELFWFWPIEPQAAAQDPALGALAGHDVPKAIRIWRDIASRGGPASVFAQRNQAVLHHMNALDLENAKLAGRMRGNSSNGLNLNVEWDAALSGWTAVGKSPVLWREVLARAKRFEDSRLSSGFVRRLRLSFLEACEHIHGHLAYESARRSSLKETRRHVKRMHSIRPDDQGSHQMLLGRCEPICREIETRTAQAGKAIDREPQSGKKVAKRLLENSEEAFAALASLIGVTSPVYQNTASQYARMALNALIAFVNETDTSDVLDLLRAASKMASVDMLVARFRENEATIKNRLKIEREEAERTRLSTMCWFCGENQGQSMYNVAIPMHGDVTQERSFSGVRYRWRHLDVDVPRCASCATAHRLKNQSGDGAWTGAILGALLGAFVGVAISEEVAILGGAAGLIGGAMVGAAKTQKSMPAGIHSLGYRYQFPDVKKLQKDGWAFGKEPAMH